MYYYLFLRATGTGIKQFKSSVLEGRASLVAQMVMNLLAMQETQVRSLGQKDPLEKDMKKESDTTE